MQFHHRGLDSFYLEASAITIGSFDGVHQGHQFIFDRLTTYAKAHSIPSVVITFFPHPIIVLRDIKEPYYLTLPDERASILFQLGIDYVVTIPFTHQLSNFTPFEFMDWVNQHIHIQHIFIGEDFALGKDRKGSPEALKEIGKILGYDLEIISFKEGEQNRVSSSRVRNYLKEGKVENANALLGRPYTIPVQILSDLKTVNRSGEIITLEMTSDPMQLLPAPGLYNAVLEAVPDIQIPFFVKPKINDRQSLLIGLFPTKTGSFPLDKIFTRLSFYSRFQKIPAGILGLEKDYPIITEIIATIHGE